MLQNDLMKFYRRLSSRGVSGGFSHEMGRLAAQTHGTSHRLASYGNSLIEVCTQIPSAILWSKAAMHEFKPEDFTSLVMVFFNNFATVVIFFRI